MINYWPMKEIEVKRLGRDERRGGKETNKWAKEGMEENETKKKGRRDEERNRSNIRVKRMLKGEMET